MDKFKLVVVGAGVFALGHSLVADFSVAVHGQTIPVKAPPKAALVGGSSTTAAIRVDAVLGKELPVLPANPKRFNQG